MFGSTYLYQLVHDRPTPRSKKINKYAWTLCRWYREQIQGRRTTHFKGFFGSLKGFSENLLERTDEMAEGSSGWSRSRIHGRSNKGWRLRMMWEWGEKMWTFTEISELLSVSLELWVSGFSVISTVKKWTSNPQRGPENGWRGSQKSSWLWMEKNSIDWEKTCWGDQGEIGLREKFNHSRPVGTKEKRLDSSAHVRYLYAPGELEGGQRRPLIRSGLWKFSAFRGLSCMRVSQFFIIWIMVRGVGLSERGSWWFLQGLNCLQLKNDFCIKNGNISPYTDLWKKIFEKLAAGWNTGTKFRGKNLKPCLVIALKENLR